MLYKVSNIHNHHIYLLWWELHVAFSKARLPTNDGVRTSKTQKSKIKLCERQPITSHALQESHGDTHDEYDDELECDKV